MKAQAIRLMQTRKYAKVPIDKIKVLNSRNRNEARFQENIRSIKDVGLLKPIVVNERNLKKNGYYDLVCGQGRYLAYKSLEYAEIPAEIIDCSQKEAYLYSLVENIARVPPGTMWFAREVKRMHDCGLSFNEISKVTGKGEHYIRDYVRLLEQGEDRLVKGVEEGLFPISFAKNVAKSDDVLIQGILMDAFDNGVVNSGNFPTVRKIIDLRMRRGKTMGVRAQESHSPPNTNYTLKQLKRDIVTVTKEKRTFVNETEAKENRLLALLDGLNTVCQDQQVVDLLTAENIGLIPNLQGAYNGA